MLTQNPLTPYDPKKMVRLEVLRPLFANGKRMEVGEIFEIQADRAGDILVTMRAKMADGEDRSLVYKKVEHF